MSSAALRLFAKQIVRRSRWTSAASSRDASPSALARRPSSASSSGGFQSAIVRSARGAASSPMTVASTPSSECASSPGFAIGRGGEDELRIGAVDPREPAQPPQHVGDVRAEDAAVDVRLVDDDVAEVVQHVGPEVVLGQHADVEHVRVGQDQVRPLADLPAALLRRVAVVDRRPDARDGELAERARLVLRERLRRVQVDRPALRVGGERVEHRQVERQRLSGGGPGRDDHVAAGADGGVRLRLVRVELLDPLSCERLASFGCSASGSGAVRAARGGSVVRYASSSPGEEVVPQRDGGHPAIEAKPRLRSPRPAPACGARSCRAPPGAGRSAPGSPRACASGARARCPPRGRS